jgi:hypothetical protein
MTETGGEYRIMNKEYRMLKEKIRRSLFAIHYSIFKSRNYYCCGFCCCRGWVESRRWRDD